MPLVVCFQNFTEKKLSTCSPLSCSIFTLVLSVSDFYELLRNIIRCRDIKIIPTQSLLFWWLRSKIQKFFKA